MFVVRQRPVPVTICFSELSMGRPFDFDDSINVKTGHHEALNLETHSFRKMNDDDLVIPVIVTCSVRPYKTKST